MLIVGWLLLMAYSPIHFTVNVIQDCMPLGRSPGTALGFSAGNARYAAYLSVAGF